MELVQGNITSVSSRQKAFLRTKGGGGEEENCKKPGMGKPERGGKRIRRWGNKTMAPEKSSA